MSIRVGELLAVFAFAFAFAFEVEVGVGVEVEVEVETAGHFRSGGLLARLQPQRRPPGPGSPRPRHAVSFDLHLVSSVGLFHNLG
jgi:hypothetical protein